MPYIIGPGVFHHNDVLHYKGDLPVVQHFNGPGQWVNGLKICMLRWPNLACKIEMSDNTRR